MSLEGDNEKQLRRTAGWKKSGIHSREEKHTEREEVEEPPWWKS